ncbi:TPA: hypothetical protein DCE37_08290 [Candidatus Latescibacteria bacterium]|nr:hypothetical protein [Candidatus Latescibacterota bacterium]
MIKRASTILHGVSAVFLVTGLAWAQPSFTDITSRAGVANSLPSTGAPRVGTGATWGDYDNDGDLDLYVTNWASSVSQSLNRLYRNNGNGTFSDVASSAGMGSVARNSVAANWIDYDNDGDLDVYVVNFFEQDQLYQNNGNGSFTRVTASANVNVIRQGDETNAAWGDYDGDGYLDIYVCKRRFRNTLYHNNGNGTFSEIGESAGVADNRDSEAAAWADYDNDGDMDLYVVNREQNNALYKNDGNGNFTEVACEVSIDNTDIGHGAAWVDYDLDGDLDLYVVNVGGNALYRNDGNDTFVNVADGDIKNTGSSWISWTSSWADYDTDGDLDVFVTNGAESESGQASALLTQSNRTFTEETGTGLSTSPTNAISSAAGDYDGDGDVDLYVVNGQFPGFEASTLYRNDSNPTTYLTIRLQRQTTDGALSADGIGLRVRILDGGTLIGHQAMTSAENGQEAVFAVPAAATVTVEVIGPTGRITDVDVDTGTTQLTTAVGQGN